MALAVLIVAIIALMILPLPPIIVDSLIALNLTLAISLLMVSLYIPTSLSLSSFPTLLLFTTLFRLALNITTTRQILLHAYAGKIIETFGSLVVAGNFIVGAVVFLIITIVQFLVIAKGSERIAEVAARFTLDAMPGKQMSIDADMRAGTIDMNTAKRRREAIQKESRMYGAMDGAMKFVKGDAIAGLIVTAVNILGGLGIGMGMKGMEAIDALKKYSILTIGDGLISQIPALFISITAGIIVTRVPSEQSENLGSDISGQILSHPRALIVGGTITALFALIPGFPAVQFVFLGLFVTGLGVTMSRSSQPFTMGGTRQPGDTPEAGRDVTPDGLFTNPLAVRLHPSLDSRISLTHLQTALEKARHEQSNASGVRYPIPLVAKDTALPENSLAVLLHDIPLIQTTLPRDVLFVKGDEKKLREVGLSTTQQQGFERTRDVHAIPVEQRQQVLDAGIGTITEIQVITALTAETMQANAAEFIGLQETRYLLERAEEKYPELTKEAIRVVTISRIADVLRRLAHDGIPIKNIRAILEALIEWGGREKDPIMLTECVRMALARSISYLHADHEGIISALIFDRATEESIRKSIRQTQQGMFLALPQETTRRLLQTIQAHFEKGAQKGMKPVILSSMDIRHHIKKLLEPRLPNCVVLSLQELSPEVQVKTIGRINA